MTLALRDANQDTLGQAPPLCIRAVVTLLQTCISLVVSTDIDKIHSQIAVM
jgi:hypothetical protein